MPGDVEIIQLVPGLLLNAGGGGRRAGRGRGRQEREVRRGPRYAVDISKYHQSLREFTIPLGPTRRVVADVDAPWTRPREAKGEWELA